MPPKVTWIQSQLHLVAMLATRGCTNLNCLHCYVDPWCHPGQGCCGGPCLGLGSYHSQGLSVLMSMVHGDTKGHTDAWGLAHNLWPYWCLRAIAATMTMLTWVSFTATWGHGVVQAWTAILGPRLGPWPTNSQDLDSCPWLLLPPRVVQMSRVWTAT